MEGISSRAHFLAPVHNFPHQPTRGGRGSTLRTHTRSKQDEQRVAPPILHPKEWARAPVYQLQFLFLFASTGEPAQQTHVPKKES